MFIKLWIMGYLRKRLFVLSSNIKQKITFGGGVWRGWPQAELRQGKRGQMPSLDKGWGGEAAGRAGEVVGAG